MSAFFTSYLEQVQPKVLSKKYPDLYFDNGTYCPQVGDLELGAESTSVEVITEYGQAAIASGAAQDFPMSDISVGKDKYSVVMLFAGCAYKDAEVRAAEFASKNGQRFGQLSEKRLMAMRRNIEVLSHNLCAYGSAKHNMFGVLNHPNVPLSNSSTLKLYKSDTTAKSILDFFNSEIYAQWNNTNFVELPNILFVSPKAFELLNGTFRSDNSDMTLKNALLEIHDYIKAIVPLRELASANLLANGVHAAGTAKDRFVLANLNMDNFSRHFTPYYQMPPSINKVNHEVFAYKYVSSVQFDFPFSARYVDYPVATT